MESRGVTTSIRPGELSAHSLLARYRGIGGFTDCWIAVLPGQVTHADDVEAFDSTTLIGHGHSNTERQGDLDEAAERQSRRSPRHVTAATSGSPRRASSAPMSGAGAGFAGGLRRPPTRPARVDYANTMSALGTAVTRGPKLVMSVSVAFW